MYLKKAIINITSLDEDIKRLWLEIIGISLLIK